MKEIPEKWYVLYSSREEFNIINDHFKKKWQYYESIHENGYTNNSRCNNWVGLDGYGSSINEIKSEGAIEISFKDFEKYIIRKEPFVIINDDYSYLKSFLKKLKIK
jgi:hypothetical protein